MIKALYRPLSPGQVLFVALCLTAGTAIYCVVYAALTGNAESFAKAISWALINLLPWFLAFEAAKRVANVPLRAAIIPLHWCYPR